MKQHKKVSIYHTPIISGRFKQKRIEIPGTKTTRSSKTIVRESLFNVLQFDIIGKRFVEVFAGSGSIGLEALSRGASRCYFMEKERTALQFLQRNIALLDPKLCEIIAGDSFENFSHLHHRLVQDAQMCYFYFDPPFAIREGMEDIYERTIDLIATINPSICEAAIIEHQSNIEMPFMIGSLKLQKKRKYGKTTLSFFQPKEGTNA